MKRVSLLILIVLGIVFVSKAQVQIMPFYLNGNTSNLCQGMASAIPPPYIIHESATVTGSQYNDFIKKDFQNNIIIAGHESVTNCETGGNRIIISKFNKCRQLIWQYKLDLYSSGILRDIALDNFGNIYFIGNATINNNNRIDLLVGKVNSNGTLAWSKTYNTSTYYNEYGTAIELDNSNNVIIVANRYDGSNNDFFKRGIVQKYLGSNGALQWTSTIQYNSLLLDVVTLGSDIYVCGSKEGSSNQVNESYLMLSKFNSSGILQWEKFKGQISESIISKGLKVATYQNSVYVAGHTFTSAPQILVCKYDPSGNLNWEKNYISIYGYSTLGDFKIRNGNLYVAGNSYLQGMVVNRLDLNGNSIWSRSIAQGTQLKSIDVDANSNVYVLSFNTNYNASLSCTQDEFFVGKINNAGTLVNTNTIQTSDFCFGFPVNVLAYANDHIYLVGSYWNGYPSAAANSKFIFYQYKYFTSQDDCEIVDETKPINNFGGAKSFFDMYPNPVNSVTTIRVENEAEVKIYDFLGKKIKEFELGSGYSEIDLSLLEKGIYIMNVIDIKTNKQESRKFIVE